MLIFVLRENLKSGQDYDNAEQAVETLDQVIELILEAYWVTNLPCVRQSIGKQAREGASGAGSRGTEKNACHYAAKVDA